MRWGEGRTGKNSHNHRSGKERVSVWYTYHQDNIMCGKLTSRTMGSMKTLVGTSNNRTPVHPLLHAGQAAVQVTSCLSARTPGSAGLVANQKSVTYCHHCLSGYMYHLVTCNVS